MLSDELPQSAVCLKQRKDAGLRRTYEAQRKHLPRSAREVRKLSAFRAHGLPRASKTP